LVAFLPATIVMHADVLPTAAAAMSAKAAHLMASLARQREERPGAALRVTGSGVERWVGVGGDEISLNQSIDYFSKTVQERSRLQEESS
jgi:hypothetical protein